MALITNPIATAVIGCAIRVHRALGPGLFESAYAQCLADELAHANLSYRQQVKLPLEHRGRRIPKAFVADFIVENTVLVELKCVTEILPIHRRQVVTYLRLSGLRKGLIMNFNALRLKDGLMSIVR